MYVAYARKPWSSLNKSIAVYLQFEFPAKIPGEPFEPAQKQSYFLVIFVMAPLQVASGAVLSPTVLARFPWYGRLFGGKQGARSVHFLLMCAFAAFIGVLRMDEKGLTEGEGRYGFFSGTISIHPVDNPQTILALEMNGAPPGRARRPVRLCLETQLGFKMVKWVNRHRGRRRRHRHRPRMGGWREDQHFYANAAGI